MGQKRPIETQDSFKVKEQPIALKYLMIVSMVPPLPFSKRLIACWDKPERSLISFCVSALALRLLISSCLNCISAKNNWCCLISASSLVVSSVMSFCSSLGLLFTNIVPPLYNKPSFWALDSAFSISCFSALPFCFLQICRNATPF